MQDVPINQPVYSVKYHYGVKQQQKNPIRLQNKRSMVAWFTITNPAPPQPPIVWLLTVKYYQAGIVTEGSWMDKHFSGKAISFMNQLQHDTMSHLVLQIYLGPTGEKLLYNVSMTTVAGQHEGRPAILRNK